MNKIIIIVLLAILSCACALDKKVYREWTAHIAKYNRKFKTSEESRMSFQNFARSHAIVQEHNKRYEAGLETYAMGLNRFSDLDPVESVRNFTGLILPEDFEHQHFSKRSTLQAGIDQRKVPCSIIGGDSSLPASISHKQYVVSIKDQGQCGSCYAHAGSSTLEGLIKKNFGLNESISVQQIIDCTYNATTGMGNLGCNGGVVNNVMDYFALATSNGKCLVRTSKLSYAAAFKSSTDCKNICSQSDIQVKVTGYDFTNRDDINACKTLLKNGPAFAMVYVDENFQRYTKGIYTAKDITTAKGYRVNHAVTAVGYGVENGVEYLEIQNSWGSGWGENGFIRIEINSALACYMLAAPRVAKI